MATAVNKNPDEVTDLVTRVFSWSIADVMNKNLYKNQVKEIPDQFRSLRHYFESFVDPLIEETRADLRSSLFSSNSSPACEINRVKQGRDFLLRNNLFYLLEMKAAAVNVSDKMRRPVYEPESGDLMALTNVLPKCFDDLNKPQGSYTIAYVCGTKDEDSDLIPIASSKPVSLGEKLFAVYLTNLTTNVRIWNTLHPAEDGCVGIINTVLRYDPTVEEHCTGCLLRETESVNLSKTSIAAVAHNLDESQRAAVTDCIALTKCGHRNSVKLIWGPPGTGKTETIASLAFNLLKQRSRTLICAPTSTAMMRVAQRSMDYLSGEWEHETYGLGDVILFGDGKRMKINDNEELRHVYLDHRTSVLAECFAPLTGWRALLSQMISLLEDPLDLYNHYLAEEEMEYRRNREADDSYVEDIPLLFGRFLWSELDGKSTKLIKCMKGLYTHMPTKCLPMEVLQLMIKLQLLLKKLAKRVEDEELWFCTLILSEVVSALSNDLKACLMILNVLRYTFDIPTFTERHQVMNFCLENACLVFCTVSSSAKLHTEGMKKPLEMVIIVEAAQLKECESCIPLQLPGLCHAVLVGDEKQLPAMVTSKICESASFCRSLFERLVSLGHDKHLLSVQYRMHPSISSFPNKEFYGGQIIDGHNVVQRSYEKSFLKGKLFGSYSFINITNGKGGLENSQSPKNVIEVHVVDAILSKLFKESVKSNKKVRVGCISPYKAQVSAIQKMVEEKYNTDANNLVSVNVRSEDGFQGGKEDIIIISTVSSSGNSSIRFLCNPQRINVALTRAKYCLWILGNDATLMNTSLMWTKLVLDAKLRGCFNNACNDETLSRAIGNALIELGQLPQSLFTTESILFKASKWKVCFDANFDESIENITDVGTRKQVAALLVKLLDGWRPCKATTIMEQCEVNTELVLVWTVDVLHEDSTDTQIIKILDIVPFHKIPTQEKIVKNMTNLYPARKMARCQYKRVVGELTLPMTWIE